MRIAFIITFCPHHRIRTFETLARYHDVDFYFFSVGEEWYWQQQHGVRIGDFHYEYLPGFHVGRTRVTPSLVKKLWRGNYDVFVKCINGRFALPVTFFIAKLRRRPFVLWTGIWKHPETFFHRLSFPLTRYIYHHADAIAVYGEHVRRYLVGLGVSNEKIFTAWHAVDNASYNQQVPTSKLEKLRTELNLSEGSIILYLGRLEESKGVSFLLEAMSKSGTDDATLLIVGTGSLRHSLEQQARRAHIADRVRFPGYISPEETSAYYALADVFVLPSITVPAGKEPWGLVVNEAMNQGLPVIATDAVGAATGGLVRDGVNGFVVPERDSQALAQAIGRVLRDAELRERMSQNARQLIAGWDNERMVKGFRQAIDYAIKNR
jgi:glycosyltransferase involved in cell wall biosynthesis